MTTDKTKEKNMTKQTELENIKQAIVNLAHAVSAHIGTDNYYDICELIYPGFIEKLKNEKR